MECEHSVLQSFKGLVGRNRDAQDRQALSCTYLAHHELESLEIYVVVVVVTIIITIIIIIITVIITIIIIIVIITIIIKGLATRGECMVAQVLPQDWALAAFCWPGWQDQDVGCEWQRQMHANLHGLHKGISPCFICAASVDGMHPLAHCCQAVTYAAHGGRADTDAADGVNKGSPRFQMSAAYVLLQMKAFAIIVSCVPLATDAALMCLCACTCVVRDLHQAKSQLYSECNKFSHPCYHAGCERHQLQQ